MATRLEQIQSEALSTAEKLNDEMTFILNELEYDLTPEEQAALSLAVLRCKSLTQALLEISREEKY